MTKEHTVKVKVKKILDELGMYYFSPQSGIYGRSGIPDLICCWQGRFIAIECKAGSNTTTALQKKELDKVLAAGGVALVVDEVNIGRLPGMLIMIQRGGTHD